MTRSSASLFVFGLDVLGRQWFDDGVFPFMPSKKVHIATAIATEGKRARLLWLFQAEPFIADRTCVAADHHLSLAWSTVIGSAIMVELLTTTNSV